MTTILSIVSDGAAKALGDRGRAVHVDTPKPSIEDVLRTPIVRGGDAAMLDSIAERREVRPEYALVAGGEVLQGPIDWQRPVADSEQIFVYNWPMEESSE